MRTETVNDLKKMCDVGITRYATWVIKDSIPSDSWLNLPLDIYGGLCTLALICGTGLVIHRERLYKRNEEILKNYYEFIENFTKFSDSLGVTEPLPLFSLYSYMVDNGYLSKDKEFDFGNNEKNHELGIEGSIVFTGEACCRHLSTMLRDIYRNKGYESNNIILKLLSIDIEEVDPYLADLLRVYSLAEPKDKEALATRIKKYIKIAYEDDARRELLTLAKRRMKNEGLGGKPVNAFDQARVGAFGDHMITYVTHKGLSHFVDPTNEVSYRLVQKESPYLYDGLIYHPVMNFSTRTEFKDSEAYKKFWRRMEEDYQAPLWGEEQAIIEDTRCLCLAHKDAFEDFYHENKGLITDTAERVLSLREKKNSR